MPPRELVTDPEIKSSAGVQVLMVGETAIAGVGILGDKSAAVVGGEIPWRTSRRLQEATYRLIKERDCGHIPSYNARVKENGTRTPFYLRSRHPKVPAGNFPLEPVVREEKNGHAPSEIRDVMPTIGAPVGDDPTVARTKVGTRRKRKTKVHCSQPPYHFQDGILEVASPASKVERNSSSSAKLAAQNLCAQKARSTVGAARPSFGIPEKQPQSCFDLHCSHISFKGWRCYRSCIAGQSFCTYHQSRSTSDTAVSLCN